MTSAGDDRPVRTLVVHCPDWPVLAAGATTGDLAAVFAANRVVAVTPAARAEGVLPGLRRREAQGRCPGLAVLGHDPARDARAFEPVAAALATLTPRVEITRPGVCSFATRGPSRYHGGDQPLAERAEAVAAGAAGGADRVRVGVADGPFAALVGAGRAVSHQPLVVAAGEAAAFLAPLPVTVLVDPVAGGADGFGGTVSGGTVSGGMVPGDRPGGGDPSGEWDDLVGVLQRLGVAMLGDLAALPASHVLARFGPVGAAAHRLARGLDPRPLDAQPLPPDLGVAAEVDPPAERADRVSFAAKALADELMARLADLGLAATRLTVSAETEHGERLDRCWRADEPLSAVAVADRLRWQLDGWLNGAPATRPSAGISRLALVPDEVVPAGERQPDFWGGQAGASRRVVRAVSRVSALLGQRAAGGAGGTDAVTVPERAGGRDPVTRVRFVAADTVDLTQPRMVDRPDRDHPWPGQVPAPSPAVVYPEPLDAEVTDGEGATVAVDGRGLLSAPPAQATVAGRSSPVERWAGPWLADERWWDPDHHRRRARLQVILGDGAAHLLVRERGRWWLEATYA